MTLYDILASLWRNAVPVIAGCIATALTHVYIDIDQQNLTAFLTGAYALAYNGLFRTLEARVDPAFGWFLGLARPPAYPKKPVPPTSPG